MTDDHLVRQRTEAHGHERTSAPRRVALVCQLDGYANGVRPRAIERFLTDRGHHVSVIDTYHLSRATGRRAGVRSLLPHPHPGRLSLYLVELARRLTRFGMVRRRLSYYVFMAEQRVRRAVLAPMLRDGGFDVVICEMPADAAALLELSSPIRLFDCPTPWADELFFEGLVTSKQREKLRDWERAIIEHIDYIAFHWESYARYAMTHYGISGQNLVTLNFGCEPAATRGRYRAQLRIAYIGSLSSEFIDLPLLARLSRLYPGIDVYGGPPPDPRLGLNYLGYSSPDVLERYQLGLITCTKDELRREGFSAKHLEYLSYGLPVLVPNWRRNAERLEGSVPYDESTFTRLVAELSHEETWSRLSDLAYSQAERLAWERTLEPLGSIVEGTR